MKSMNLKALTIAALALALAGCSNAMMDDPTENIDPIYYTVNFNNDGTIISTQKVESGKTVIRPDTDPTNAPHNFLGWYNGENLYNFGTPVTSNVNLTAKWTSTVTVEDKIRFDSTNSYYDPDWASDMSETGYVIMDMASGTFENYQVLTSTTLYGKGTFTKVSTGYSFIIAESNDKSILGTTLYTLSGSSWTYTKDPFLYGFGHSVNKTTTVTKTIVASHTEEQ